MTERDYQLIADTIRAISRNPYMRARMAGEFCITLSKAFPNFNQDHFVDACKTDEHGHDGEHRSEGQHSH
jgi:hypothetical protein